MRYFRSGPNTLIQADRLVPKFLSHSKNGREKGLSRKILTKIVITAKIIVNFKIVKVTLNSLQVIVIEIFSLRVLYRLC